MTKLETSINIVLQQLKTKLATETWMSRRRYFNQMLKLAESLGINEPCQKLYAAFVADDNGSKERRSLHIYCVKLLDAATGTQAKNESGVPYNESPLPCKEEVLEYFQNRQYPLTIRVNIDHLIVKSEIEMQPLGLSESTIGQYRHAWMDIRRYFINNGSTVYDERLIQDFLQEVDSQWNSGFMEEWKRKINRKAAHVLKEVVNTGIYKWKLIKPNINCSHTEIESIRIRYLASLTHRNLSQSTIDLHDYVFRKTVGFIGAETEKELQSLSPDKVQLAIISFAEVCNKRSMTTIVPILRSLLVFLYTDGIAEWDLSGVVMSAFMHRGSVAAYISEKDRVALTTQLDDEPKRDKAIILLAIKLGLRDCDISNLTFQDIDWHNDKILLNQKKTGEPLVLPLIPDVGNALMDYILNERPKREDRYPFIFLRKQAPHNKLASVYPICSNLLQEMGIKPVNGTGQGVHVFRYTMVHRMLVAKVPHQVITDALGHASKESDKPYISMEESMLRMCALDLSIIGRISWKGAIFNE